MLTQVEQRRLKPTRGSGDGGAIGSKIDGSCARDTTGDESFGKTTMLKNPPQVQDKEGGKDQ